MEKVSLYDCFIAALKREVNKNWAGRCKVLAANSFISFPFLSQIMKGKKRPSLITQVNICNAIGFATLESFWEYGRTIIESENHIYKEEIFDGTAPENEASDINSVPTATTKTIIHFPKNGNHNPEPVELTPEQIRLQQMHENLDAIFESGDIQLIAAIEMNLISFKQAIDQKKQTEMIKQEMASMREQMKTIIGNSA